MKKFFILPVLSILIFSCKSPEEKALADIEKAEKALFSEEENKVNEEAASELIEAYGSYAEQFPDKEKTPEYLFKKAELHRSLGQHREAIATWQNVHDRYPEYEKAPFSLFLQGFTYENDLNNVQKAKEVYSEFLNKYPDHELSDDVMFSLANLGKSPEDIIKEFEDKNKMPEPADTVNS